MSRFHSIYLGDIQVFNKIFYKTFLTVNGRVDMAGMAGMAGS
jgi:hypothetical protein